MVKATFYMSQFVDPIAFLNEEVPMSFLRKRSVFKDILRHQRYNADQPYVANLGAGRLLIVETPFEIERLATWLAGRD